MDTERYEDFLDELESLIQLDYDAIEAYEAAANRIKNTEYKDQLTSFKKDYQRHVKELSSFLDKKENRESPTGPGLKSLLTQGKVVLANLVGDPAILKAMKSNEQETNKAYQHINDYDSIPTDLKEILRKGYEDEKRHLDWIEKELQRVA